MQVKLGQYSFHLPNGWRDTSSYVYKAKDQKRALSVSLLKARESVSLEQLASQRCQEMLDMMGNDVEFLSQQRGKIATLPAIYLSFKFGDDGKQYLEYWAMAAYAENTYLAVSYVGPQEDKSLEAEFKRIMATSVLNSHTELEQAEAKYVWRQAHMLHFLAPIELIAPRHYTFVSPSGISLKASLYSPAESCPGNSVADHAATDLRFGGIQGDMQESTFSNLAIQQVGYVFQGGDPLEPTRYMAHRAQVTGLGGRLHFFVKGFESQAKQIDEFWLPLITSLLESGQQGTATVAADDSSCDEKSP